MKVFLSFIKKESLHILRDPRTMLIVLVVPVALMLLFGFAISTEVNNVSVMAVAPVHSPIEKTIVQRLEANPYFTFKGYIAEQEIDEVLRSGKAMAVVVFSATLEQDMLLREQGIDVPSSIQIILDAANTNTATTAGNYLQTVLSGEQSAQAMFSTHLRHNPQMKSAYNFVPGVMGLIFILICAMMTSVSIVREKEAGTMEVLLVSPIKPIVIVLAKMVPYFVLSCVNLITILLIAHYIMDVPMAGGVAIVGLSLLYLVLALALGLFVSTMAQTQITALLFSAVVMLVPMMMLSGMMYPIENLPPVLKQITYIVPARWYIEAIKKLMIAGVPFGMVLKEFFILLTMTLFLIGVSLKKFNDKLE